MGYITECRDAGIPEQLLIPIQPPYMNQASGEMEGGKEPAMMNGLGEWAPLANWGQLTLPWQAKVEADQSGANCGLVLGCGVETDAGPMAFAAVDIDFLAGREEQRDKFINHFAAVWPETVLLIRETVPYRAMLLVRITDAFSTGRKGAYYLQYKDTELGKIELLTTGQQCIISGRHYSGNEISWHPYGSEERWKTPRIYDKMPAFRTFVDLAESIRGELEKLAGLGYTYTSSSAGSGELVPDAELVPDWLTLDILRDYIKRTPNAVTIDRDGYVAFMQAIAACKHGLEVRHGPLAPDQAERLLNLAAEWAASWPGNKDQKDAYVTERLKCENDWFKQRGGFRTGWHRLINLSKDFGYQDAVTSSAQDEFKAAQCFDNSPPPLKEDDKQINRAVLPMRAAVANDPKSDTSYAEWIAHSTPVGQVAAYLLGMPKNKQWHYWNDARNCWDQEDALEHLKRDVEFQIANYLNKFANPDAGWKESDIKEGRSARKRRSVMELMDVELATQRDTQKQRYMLQTPTGTYDLRNGRALSLPERKELFDTRVTNVGPDFETKQTPYFDKLIYGLAEGNPEIIEWIWHYLGYSLLGDPRAECFLVVWGPGGNGKSKLIETLGDILGGYYRSINADVLLESGKNLHPTSLKRLEGGRLAVIAELEAKDKWNESLLKRITGGDKINARDMHENETEFKSEGALLITTNELPTFSKVTPAILRRFRVIGTTWQPSDAERDSALKERIMLTEAGAVLAKLMSYARKVWNPDAADISGHMLLPPVPKVMMAVTNSILEQNDTMFGWMHAECDHGPAFADAEETIDELKSRYDAWAARNNKGGIGSVVGDAVNDRKFKDGLKRFGIALTDAEGQPLRRTIRAGASKNIVFIARGIRLKVKAAAA